VGDSTPTEKIDSRVVSAPRNGHLQGGLLGEGSPKWADLAGYKRSAYQNPGQFLAKARAETKRLGRGFCCTISICFWYIWDMRVALYARVSTKDKGQDCENQLLELKKFVARKRREGWETVAEYVDKVSGKSPDRPAFRRLFEDAAQKKFDLLLFWSLDRFSREGVIETLQHLERLKQNGVAWWSFKEEYLRSIGPFADAVLAILACIAKQERIRLSDRVLAGLNRARAQGRVLGRPRAAVRPGRVQELRRSGMSIRRIAAETHVSPMTIQRILANRAGVPTIRATARAQMGRAKTVRTIIPRGAA